MATRFYLPASGTAAVSPAFGSGWNTTTGASRHPAVTAKSGTALANGTARTKVSQAGAQNVLDRQYVSAPLNAQTISGTFSAWVQGLESTTAADAWLQIVIRVVSGDGATQRGVLYAGSTATAVSATAGAENQEFGTALASRIKSALALTSVAAQAGDRLVIEVGYRAITANTNTATLRYGDPTGSTDPTLSAGSTSTTTPPYVELSQDLVFQPLTNRAARVSSDTTGYRLLSANLPPATHTMTAFVRLETLRAILATIYEVAAGQTAFIQTGLNGADGVSLGIHQNGNGGDSTADLTQGAWWKFCQVVNATTVILRAAPIASALAQVQTLPLVAYPGGTGQASFGYSTAWSGEFWVGDLCGIKLWAAELTLSEADAEFTQYKAVRTANLFGEYTMWNGPSLTDSSGNARDLSLAAGASTSPADVAGPPGIPLTASTPTPTPRAGHQFHVLAA